MQWDSGRNKWLTVVAVGLSMACASQRSNTPLEGPEARDEPVVPEPWACIGVRPPRGGTPDSPPPTLLTDSCNWLGREYAAPQRWRSDADAVTASPSQYLLIRLKTPRVAERANEATSGDGGLADGAVETDRPLPDGPRAQGTLQAVPNIWRRVSQVTLRAGSFERQYRREANDPETDTIAISLRELSNLPNQTVVAVEVIAERVALVPQLVPTTFYFTLSNHVSAYGVAGTGAYAWVPVGLFATNFRATGDGIPFVAFPVGIAAGLRFSPGSSSGYLGLSAMLNWVLNPAAASTENASGTVVNLAGASLGLLLDVNNIFYLGGAYVFDFRSGVEHPGFAAVVGIGPGLLQFLQASRR